MIEKQRDDDECRISLQIVAESALPRPGDERRGRNEGRLCK
jgi:hypothetical protein